MQLMKQNQHENSLFKFYRNSLTNRINHLSFSASNSPTPSPDEMRRREARLQRFKDTNKVKRTPAPSPSTPATPNPVRLNALLQPTFFLTANNDFIYRT